VAASSRTAVPVAAAAAVACALAQLLVWHRSGDVERSGVGLGRSADRLELVDASLGVAVVEAWRAMPVLAALAVALALVGSARAAGVVSAVAGGLSVAAAVVAAVWIPGARPGGPAVAAAAGLVALVAGLWSLRTRSVSVGPSR
jgi:hypothetical protein